MAVVLQSGAIGQQFLSFHKSAKTMFVSIREHFTLVVSYRVLSCLTSANMLYMFHTQSKMLHVSMVYKTR